MTLNLYLLLALAGLGPLGLSGSPQEPVEKPAPEVPAKKDKHLKQWPKLKSLPEGKTQVTRLRKARTEEMGTQAHAALVHMGAGVAPLLIAGLGKERNLEAQTRMVTVLDLVTDGTHTRLIEPAFGNRTLIVRVWSLRRTALFPDSALQAAAEKALVAARKRKRGTDEEIEDERFAAALASGAAGSLEGFDILGLMASKHWGKEGVSLRTALEGTRGAAASKLCAEGLSGERQAVVQSLRMLAGCGDDSVLGQVAAHLDSTDNSIRVEAINTCRGLVDGDPPLPRLSAFQAIELAKEWRARL